MQAVGVATKASGSMYRAHAHEYSFFGDHHVSFRNFKFRNFKRIAQSAGHGQHDPTIGSDYAADHELPGCDSSADNCRAGRCSSIDASYYRLAGASSWRRPQPHLFGERYAKHVLCIHHLELRQRNGIGMP